MLIDLIDVEKLPNWLVWLDWCFSSYKTSLFVFIGLGVIGWLVYCYIKQNGFAVG